MQGRCGLSEWRDGKNRPSRKEQTHGARDSHDQPECAVRKRGFCTASLAIMERPYRWRCFACDEPNEPLATSCSSCGFPARASGAEIAKARAAWRTEGSPARRPYSPPSESIAESQAKWSGWRKGLAIAGAALLAISGYAWMGSFSWPRFALSLFACMFGALLLLVACVARDRSDG